MPDGRRLLTGSSSGEFTLWNAQTFNFETILQVSSSNTLALHPSLDLLTQVRTFSLFSFSHSFFDGRLMIHRSEQLNGQNLDRG